MRIECPSGLIIEARKPQGAELKTLARATDERDAGSGLAEILRACWQSTEDPGPYPNLGSGSPDWKRIIANDVLVTLIHLRKSVLGSTFEFHVGCEHCGAKNELEADLNGIDVQGLPEATVSAMRAKQPIECTSVDGRRVRFEIGTIRHQEYLRDQLKQMRRRPEWQDHTPSIVDILAAQMTFVSGIENSKGEDVSNEFVKRLQWLLKADVDVIYDLRDKFDQADAEVDTGVEFTCQACRWEQKPNFPLGFAFFGPTKPKRVPTPPSSETKSDSPAT